MPVVSPTDTETALAPEPAVPTVVPDQAFAPEDPSQEGQKPELKTVKVTIIDGQSNKITVEAPGDTEHMPTRIDHQSGKTVIFFPRGN